MQMPALPTTPPPLVDTFRRVSAIDTRTSLTVGTPSAAEWERLSALAEPEVVAAAFDRALAQHGDRRVAAFAVGSAPARVGVETWALPAFVDRRVPDCDTSALWVRRDADGRIDGIAVEHGSMTVIAGDPSETHAEVRVVADESELWEALADRFSTLASPFEVIAESLPIGLPALWGNLADAIAGRGLWLARAAGLDQVVAWRRIAALLTAIAARNPALRVHPAPFPVDWSQGTSWFIRRGTCCLWYRTQDEPDPDGDGYCGTCPLRSDDSRTRRFCAHLENEG